VHLVNHDVVVLQNGHEEEVACGGAGPHREDLSSDKVTEGIGERQEGPHSLDFLGTLQADVVASRDGGELEVKHEADCHRPFAALCSKN
jgi:hypothetical protein